MGLTERIPGKMMDTKLRLRNPPQLIRLLVNPLLLFLCSEQSYLKSGKLVYGLSISASAPERKKCSLNFSTSWFSVLPEITEGLHPIIS